MSGGEAGIYHKPVDCFDGSFGTHYKIKFPAHWATLLYIPVQI